MTIMVITLLTTLNIYFEARITTLSATSDLTQDLAHGKKALTGEEYHEPRQNNSIDLVSFTEPQMLYVEGILKNPEPLYTIPVLHAPIPAARSQFKSWMDWRSITYRNSRQWRRQQIAYTCDTGFRRVNGLYMIALGTYFLYQGVGDVFDITLSSGITFRGVVGDVKSDRHTDPTNRFHVSDGSIVEFIVDRQVMCRYALFTRGDVSFAGFPGEVVFIERIPELFIEV